MTYRSLRRLLITGFLGGLPVCLAAEHPLLLFRGSDLDAIRSRTQLPAYAQVWEQYSGRARDLVGSATVLDPQADMTREGDRDVAKAKMLLGHKVGRELSTWMEVLGTVYHVTGDDALATRGVGLLTETAERFPISQEWMARGFAGGRGDFMRGLALGYDFFYDHLSPAQRQDLRRCADGYINHFLSEAENPDTWWYGVHNFNGVCGGAAGMLCLAFGPSEPVRYGAQRDRCVAVIRRWLDTSFDEQGAYSEGVGYSQYGLANSLLFARALTREGGPNLFDHPHLRQLARYYTMSLLPGEALMDARNDSGYGRVDLECLLLATETGDGLAQWLYELRGGPQAPWAVLIASSTPATPPVAAGVPLNLHFEGRGLAVWRTGWAREDVMFSVEAGPFYPITHNQGDKGHFTLYGFGHRWAVDPGYGNDRGFPLSRCHTLAHNCILIDGKGQAPSGSGLGTDGHILAYRTEPGYGYALSDCTPAYQANTRGQAGVGARRALRHTFFVRPRPGIPAYAVVLDDIEKDDEPHDFTWQMLTWPTMQVTCQDGGFDVRPRTLLGDACLTTPEGAVGGSARWTLDVTKAGTYHLWGRVRAMGAEAGKSDSFFVTVGDEPRIDWHMPGSREWMWGRVGHSSKQDERSFSLPAGPCRIVVQTREPQAQLDVLGLVPVEAEPPDDENPPALLLKASAGEIEAPMVLAAVEDLQARLLVRVQAANPTTCTRDTYEPDDGRQPASFPRLRGTTHAVNPRFVAVLVPIPGALPEPEVAVQHGPGDVVTVIQWPDRRDTIRWPARGEITVTLE